MTDDASGRADRARGALLGLAVGDALGAPLVGFGREQARIKHGIVEGYLGGGLHLLAPGANTARVLLARAAALALLDEPPLGERLVARYQAVLDSGAPGIGEATRAALDRIREHGEVKRAVEEAHEALERRTAGVGPALRCVPYALVFCERQDALVDAVLADAALTHADPRAGAAAAALALWVAELVGGAADIPAAYAAARERLAGRVELPDVLPDPRAVARLAVRPTAFAPDVLHAVLHDVLEARGPRGALVRAVNEAGEAAAIGAAAGAVLGARFGASSLPESWVLLLQGGLAWPRLADRLLARSGAEGGGEAASGAPST
jgi:ADP-ribosyl-[dinitrogen reductase] hydrolase